MNIAFTKFDNSTNWVSGKTDTGYSFHAKLFDVPSVHGIDEGRVSKFSLLNGDNTIYHYDRGLDFDDIKSKEPKETFKAVLKFLEESPQRFN